MFVNIWPWRPSPQIIMRGYEHKWHPSWKYNSHKWINKNPFRKFTTQREIPRHKHHRFREQVETTQNIWQLPHFILKYLERNTIINNCIKIWSHLKKKNKTAEILLCRCSSKILQISSLCISLKRWNNFPLFEYTSLHKYSQV